jgi:peptidoglycan/xylan/chitin deacetylase (PgdA/CDA1 family)
VKVLDLAIRCLSSRAARPLFRRMMRGRSTIFMLHRLTDPATGISGHTVEFVREALSVLKSSGARLVSVRQIVDAYARGKIPGDDWVAFTMDDGFADQGELVRSAFIPCGCPVTIFLITGFLDGKIWPWDDRLAYIMTRSESEATQVAVGGQKVKLSLQSESQRHRTLEQVRSLCKSINNADLYGVVDSIAQQLQVQVPVPPPPAFRPLTWDDVRDLESQGVDFAPHSITHRIFSQLSREDAIAEIAGSWQRVQQELRRPLPVFAWPTGRPTDYSERDVGLLRELGLSAYATTEADYAFMGRRAADAMSPYSLRRFALPTRIRDVLQYGSWIERGKQIARRTVRSRRPLSAGSEDPTRRSSD